MHAAPCRKRPDFLFIAEGVKGWTVGAGNGGLSPICSPICSPASERVKGQARIFSTSHVATIAEVRRCGAFASGAEYGVVTLVVSEE